MYKQKLIDLLKSCDSVKGAMEKLEFGCRINNGCEEGIIFKKNKSKYNDSYEYVNVYGDICEICFDGVNDDYEGRKIIGLPLQERFIRMYCENKNINYSIHKDGFGIQYKGIIKLDNTKDFDNQSEETYMDIFNALIDIK